MQLYLESWLIYQMKFCVISYQTIYEKANIQRIFLFKCTYFRSLNWKGARDTFTFADKVITKFAICHRPPVVLSRFWWNHTKSFASIWLVGPPRNRIGWYSYRGVISPVVLFCVYCTLILNSFPIWALMNILSPDWLSISSVEHSD